jgi:hypothetical protein
MHGGKTMSVPETLASLVGEWAGTSRLWLPGEPTRESETTASVALTAQGKFVTIAYTWAFEGQPQDGLLLLGRETESVHVAFVDSWHMGDVMMICRGRVHESGAVDVLGSYSVPDSPDWGWRIVIEPGDNILRILMYNVPPEGMGEEELGVEAVYSRS